MVCIEKWDIYLEMKLFIQLQNYGSFTKLRDGNSTHSSHMAYA